SAQALGFEIIGRKVIVNDPDFRNGDFYRDAVVPGRGLSYARMIGHLTYLSALSMHEKFGRNRKAEWDEKRFETGFEVESYLNHQGEQFVKRFDANSYLHITWAMDHFDLVHRYGSLEKAFAPSKAEFLLVALSSDWLFFPEQTRELGRVLLGQKKIASLVELESPYGHDAFLLEIANLSQVLNGFLEKPAFENGRGRTAAGESNGRSAGFAASRDMESLASLIEPGSHILD